MLASISFGASSDAGVVAILRDGFEKRAPLRSTPPWIRVSCRVRHSRRPRVTAIRSSRIGLKQKPCPIMEIVYVDGPSGARMSRKKTGRTLGAIDPILVVAALSQRRKKDRRSEPSATEGELPALQFVARTIAACSRPGPMWSCLRRPPSGIAEETPIRRS
jgi:hypothetical protein